MLIKNLFQTIEQMILNFQNCLLYRTQAPIGRNIGKANLIIELIDDLINAIQHAISPLIV